MTHANNYNKKLYGKNIFSEVNQYSVTKKNRTTVYVKLFNMYL